MNAINTLTKNTSTKNASTQTDQEMSTPQTDELIKSIGIPARPVTLINLQKEIESDDPDLRKASALVTSDVTLTVAVLRTVNSSAFGLSRKCETVEQAVFMIGFKRLKGIVTGLILRNLMRGDAQQLAHFWDVSAKRSHAMTQLASDLGLVDSDIAHSFGLFCDVGIPLLMLRFADYNQTLAICHEETERTFTQVEQAKYRTDHALIGAIMARSWDLSPTLTQAIRLHHDYSIFTDSKVPEVVKQLVAMNLIAELAIQRFSYLDSAEWNKGGADAVELLAMTDYEITEWIDRLSYDFAKTST